MPYAFFLARRSLFLILLVGIGVILICALIHYYISYTQPEMGVLLLGKPLDHESLKIDCWTRFLYCFYLSVTTFTSLGFADLTPGLHSKYVVVAEVIFGAGTIGLSIAKLIEMGTSDLGSIRSKCSTGKGFWLDRVVDSTGDRFGIIWFSPDRNYGIAYSGQNFDRDGNLIGTFTSHLVELDGSSAIFRWTREQSAVGETKLTFICHGRRRASQYSGMMHEFRSEKVNLVEGYYISGKAKRSGKEAIKALIDAQFFGPATEARGGWFPWSGWPRASSSN
jgi:Ion channel